MRIGATWRGGILVLAALASSACWNRIEVHSAPVAEDSAASVETRVLGWSEEPAGAAPEAGVVAHVDDGERTYHVVVGENGQGRPWSAAFTLDE